MKNIALTYFLMLYVLTLVVYYGIGGSQFPDYQNYLYISQNSGSNLTETYFTEFLTQYLLSNKELVFLEFNNVDVLAIFVQVFVLVSFSFAVLKNEENIYPVMIFSSLYLPLFLTTTLRAAPLYSLFFVTSLVSFRYGLKFTIVIFFTLAGSLFHDSFILISLTLLSAFIIQKFIALKIRHCIIILFIATLILLLGPAIKSIILDFADLGFLGARSGYIEVEKFSVAKIIYVFIFICIALIHIIDRRIRIESKFLSSYLTLSLCVLYVVSDIAAIRYSIFVIAYFIAAKSSLLFTLEYRRSNYIFIIPLFFILFSIQYKVLL